MRTKFFRWALLLLIVVMALVVGGACYQTFSIVPFWQQDISMFKNYGHWGIDYFPILSPLMTVLWLATVIIGFKVRLSEKKILYIGHFFFLIIMVTTFTYFAPFLLTYMGHPENTISDNELKTMLNTWAKWDILRQVVGLIPFTIFIYCYGNIDRHEQK